MNSSYNYYVCNLCMVQKEEIASSEETDENKHWGDFNQEIKTITKSGDYSWQKIILAADKETGKKFLSLYKFRQRYNIKSKKQLSDLLNAIFLLSEEIDWDIEMSDEEKENIDSMQKQFEEYKTKSQVRG